MIRRLACKVGLVGAICVTALGGFAVAASSQAVAQTTTPSTIVLTNSSNGSTVVAAKGDFVVVRLTASDGVQWSEASIVPSTSATPVLVKKSGHVKMGSSVTTFKVVGYGSATLEATGTPICTGSICPQYVLLWEATVDVPVQDPPGT